MNTERIYTVDELNELCSEWQRRLRLQDWDIVVQLTHQNAIDDVMAQIAVNAVHKRAIISVPTPETYSSKVDLKQDMLTALIHELIHLHLEPFFPDQPKEGEEPSQGFMEAEYVINALSGAFSDLYDESEKGGK